MNGLSRRWTGADVKALRAARRLSVRDFAAHLGVAQRTVSYWEASDTTTPTALNQSNLDTSLARASVEEQARFRDLVPVDEIGESDAGGDASVQPERTRHSTDGRSMTAIPEGIYLSGPADRPVWVPAFWIDTYPVTNADYALFVTAAHYPPPPHWNGPRPPTEITDHPVVWVTHHDARAYAQWAGKRLPTAEEWEKAARGTSGDVWPWGNQPTPAKCNIRQRDRPGATTPVDRYRSGVSPYGVYDLTGNTWEWTSTPTADHRHQLKGGSFNALLEAATPSAFNDAALDMSDDDTSFRCATDLPRLTVDHQSPTGPGTAH